MHAKLMKMMEKKRDLSPSEKKAKMDAVHEMRGAASEMMGDKMDGLKKVSVMSNSKDGLAHGLDKAKEIVSQGQQDQMSSDAEAPYSDAKHAQQEHDGEQQSDEFGNMPGMADGGPVIDPNAAQSAQDSMRQAFHFNEGGEVESPDLDNSEEGYPAREESDDSEDGSPADAEASDEGDSDGEEMSHEEIDAQLAKLMKMKQKMESKNS
jgi:hypothetical protein